MPIQFPGATEEIVVGGRDKFKLLGLALAGVKQIGVLGYASQGRAQAMNLCDSLKEYGIKVVVGLRKGSLSFAEAAKDGFKVENGTAGEMIKVARESDFVILLIKDAAQAAHWEEIQDAMKSGAALGLSHGFLLGYLKNIGRTLRDDIDVIGECPKGMGASVRRLYEQGVKINGAGINSSYAIEQDVSGNAENIALGWAIGVGSPYVFKTTLTMEYLSDISGERGSLLGAPWGTAEAMNDYYIGQGLSDEDAFMHSAMAITGPISKALQEGGLLRVAEQVPEAERDAFFETLYLTRTHAIPLCERIYNEVKSGREIARVIDDTRSVEEYGWTTVDATKMWRTGETARLRNVEVPLDARTAGAYLGIMLAQVEVLRKNGHCWSETINETIIEAHDSLNPYMHKRGIQYLIDNCSTTARLGGRTWGPQWRQLIIGDVIAQVGKAQVPTDFRKWFYDHPVHEAHRICSQFRPPVDIAVQ